MKIFVLLVVGWLVSACQTVSSQVPSDGLTEGVPAKVDQMAYFSQLKAKRPQLVIDDCKNNLIAKPKYRNAILSGATDYSRIISNEYSPELQASDKKWADSFRESASGLKAKIGKINKNTDFYVANYPPDRFVGYHVGRPTEYDGEGLGRKVYLEFNSAVEYLTPEIYLAFSEALRKAGFNGDSKVQLGPGVARYQFNNIVIHAGSLIDAVVAEKVSRQFFAGNLASMGRGLDVKLDQHGYDWNRFLCSQDTSKLPPSAFQYLGIENNAVRGR